MADEPQDEGVDDILSTASHEDDEVSPKDDTEPDPEVGDPPTDDEDADRPIAWRPGRRHGRSAESERRGDD